jgi:hypothetical protein
MNCLLPIEGTSAAFICVITDVHLNLDIRPEWTPKGY